MMKPITLVGLLCLLTPPLLTSQAQGPSLPPLPPPRQQGRGRLRTTGQYAGATGGGGPICCSRGAGGHGYHGCAIDQPGDGRCAGSGPHSCTCRHG